MKHRSFQGLGFLLYVNFGDRVCVLRAPVECLTQLYFPTEISRRTKLSIICAGDTWSAADQESFFYTSLHEKAV
jgi:hypothetical protein